MLMLLGLGIFGVGVAVLFNRKMPITAALLLGLIVMVIGLHTFEAGWDKQIDLNRISQINEKYNKELSLDYYRKYKDDIEGYIIALENKELHEMFKEN